MCAMNCKNIKVVWKHNIEITWRQRSNLQNVMNLLSHGAVIIIVSTEYASPYGCEGWRIIADFSMDISNSRLNELGI